jgi:hypothetical protein
MKQSFRVGDFMHLVDKSMGHIGGNYDPSAFDKFHFSHTLELMHIKKNKTLYLHSAQLHDNESGECTLFPPCCGY